MRAMTVLRRAAAAAIDLLYPERCVGCGRFGASLCEGCAAALVPATGPGRCPNCSAEWRESLNCPRCASWRSLDQCLAVAEMTGAARQAVHGLKYRGIRSLASVMAGRIAGLAGEDAFDAAFAIPLHPSRVRVRGFNQAELLARLLPWPPAPGRLERRRRTRTQVSLRERERRANVADAFAYSGPSLHGLRIALVDDVVTTGATADECAAVLKEHGARTVVALAFARASYPHGSERPIET